ncbi:hypothetical protein CHU98_g10568 [Xylaria longipes]|nr:hypothetical protein CHU98_g10568 [Xylaria longipes]
MHDDMKPVSVRSHQSRTLTRGSATEFVGTMGLLAQDRYRVYDVWSFHPRGIVTSCRTRTSSDEHFWLTLGREGHHLPARRLLPSAHSAQ